MGICDGHFSPLALALRSAPPLPFERTHLERVTDHFKHRECVEAITLPSGHLHHPCLRSLVDFEWAFLYYPHSSAQWESSLC